MAIVEVQVEQWQERAIQVLVLLSFSMQLVLLVLAEFRRRIDSGLLRVVIWSAYVLADSTALYTLGHLSVTSRSGDHKLMAFWAPFLLVHLGGQDNITAYAIEDNQLWRRHLQTLIVQVAAAAYILYESTMVGTEALLRSAAVLMFVVGIVKYGERVWALKRADTSASANANGYQSFEENTNFSTRTPSDRRHTEDAMRIANQWSGTRSLLRVAYLLLDVPKDMIQGPLSSVELHLHDIRGAELYKVVEMQLGLMHDALYSKAEVIHTWYGLCIRVISPVFTAVALVLFHRSAGDHQYSRADVTITYVLSGGALTLEMVSMLRVMFSRWPSLVLWKLAYNDAREERHTMWGTMGALLAHASASIRRFFLLERHESRWWSDSMGQYNLIELCISNKDNRASRTVSSIVSWMGIQDRWNTLVYSRSIPVPEALKEIVVEHVLRSRQRSNGMYYSSVEEKQDYIINSRGQAALRKRHLYERLGRFVDMELDDSIIVWHLATDIFLRRRKDQGPDDWRHFKLMETTEVISNYMFFLFVARPYMLPGYVSHTRYTEICYHLTGLKYNTAEDLISLLMSEFKHKEDQKYILYAIGDLVHELLSLEYSSFTEVMQMITEVWTEMLCYAGYRCSGYSHAKQLSNGGELLTIVALVVEYHRRDILLLEAP